MKKKMKADKSEEMQDTLLRYIKSYRNEYDYSPSFREMLVFVESQGAGNSLSYVKWLLDRLEERELLVYQPFLARSAVPRKI
jgi:SOS-response transcriptional repressor LexA